MQKGFCVGLFDTELDASLAQGFGQVRHLGLQRRAAQRLEHVFQQLDMHRAHRVDALCAGVEFRLLLLNPATHVGDHRGILATQAAQLEHLVVEVAAAHVQHPTRFRAQTGNTRGHGRLQDVLALPHHTLAQNVLQHRQGTGAQQGVIVCDLGHQALLGRHRNHLAGWHPQNGGRGLPLPLDLRGHQILRAERIPQRVDLVEHHQPGVVRGTCLGGQMVTPDRKVRAGDTRIGTQDKNNAMRLRQQAHRELRLGTNRIQARCVQDNQALLQQRVCDVDQRMPPHRDFDQAVCIRQRVFFGQFIVPKAQGACVVLGDTPCFRHLGQGSGQLVSVMDIQRNMRPALWHQTPLRQRVGFQAGVDRQQTQAGGNTCVVTQLSRAHGGAPRTGRHDAPPVVGKKYGVD